MRRTGIYASDGQGTLVRSDDDGCTWQDISPVAATVGGAGVGPRGGVDRAPSAAPSSSTSASYLYIGANVRPTNALPVSLPSQPVCLREQHRRPDDVVASSGKGLPPVGTITDIAAADLAPRTVYVDDQQRRQQQRPVGQRRRGQQLERCPTRPTRR